MTKSVSQMFLDRVKTIKEPDPKFIGVIAEESVNSTAMAIGDLGDYAYAEELAEYNKKKQDPDFIDLDEEIEFDEDSIEDALEALAGDLFNLDDTLEDDEVDRLVSTEKYAKKALIGLQEQAKLPSHDERLNPQATLADIMTRKIGEFKLSKKGEVKGKETEFVEETPEDIWVEDDDFNVEMQGSLTQDYLEIQDDIFGTYGDKFTEKFSRVIKAVDNSNDTLVAVWNPRSRVLMTQTIEDYEEDDDTIAVYVNTDFGGDMIAEEDYDTIEVDGFSVIEEEVKPVKKSVKKPKLPAKKKKPATIAQLVKNKRKASLRFKRQKGKMKAKRQIAMKKMDIGTLRKRAWKSFLKTWHKNIAKKQFKVDDPKTLPLQKQVLLDQLVQKRLPLIKRKFNKFLANYIKQAKEAKASKGKEK